MTDLPLPYTDEAHQQAAQWLTEEAYLLDRQRYAQWLERMTDDVRYIMPVRVTTARSAGFDTLAGMSHFDEDLFSLRKRVARFETEHAWTEDPPSRLRHFVSNVRTFAGDAPGELRVESYVLVFRSRGDVREGQFLPAGRDDTLRREGGGLKLARRVIEVDESVLRMQNLGIFL
ncbi:3-phenylpropionate/cinnamic acid dioxygenase subunit beta [Actinomadura sp. 7K507]|uniref:3-phenylpropionate/cinnamic acid dioxygenase subunit beta n=1 Tax=Actinomadura sp. 7K507 TaxID=2530365 RepID=UPI001FB6406C|nr:3-phenylpropionate/cinnamic acid dioxygenase subunit beta [Actinomadura sp. 7K507]